MVNLNALLGQLIGTGGQALKKGSRVLDTPGKKILAGGAGAALLFTGTGREVLKYGGVAALGALAYQAWKNHNTAKDGEEAPAAPQSLTPPPAGSGFVPQDEGARESLAKLLIAAMVTAAKSDGTVDEEEQQAILNHSEALQLTPEEQSLLFEEMGKPFDMEPVVKAATTPEIATEVYAVSVVAIGTPSTAERAYLKMLAKRLQLPDDVVASLHRTLGAQPA
ncbi:MAG: tellurite resistance TerB family protein [Rhodospirillales bacterium]|nr:tellurite resistance TerB family protein [Rhodospirillales bacterium]